MPEQALGMDVRSASRLHSLLLLQIAVWAHPISPFTYLVSGPGRCALRRLAAHSQEYSPSARRLWPSLWYRSTACTIFCGSFSTPLVDSGDLLTFGLPPAAPLLSALAYHVSPCTNVLYSIFFVFF